jgi:ABC-type transporter MlaC component
MKKTLLAAATISVAAFAYANTASDSSALVSQQCKISAEAVSTLKTLQYGNTSIRKDVASLIDRHLKTQENRDLAHKKLNLMVDDKTIDAATLEGKYCS